MQKILVDRGETRRIAQLLNCTPQMVRKAVRGDSETDLALRIRKIAIARGGAFLRIPK